MERRIRTGGRLRFRLKRPRLTADPRINKKGSPSREDSVKERIAGAPGGFFDLFV